MFQARDPNISGMKYSMVMQFMPLPEETKLKMCLQLMDCSMPIFKDRKVIILMILITVFDLDNEENVKRIKNGFLNILKSYLKE